MARSVLAPNRPGSSSRRGRAIPVHPRADPEAVDLGPQVAARAPVPGQDEGPVLALTDGACEGVDQDVEPTGVLDLAHAQEDPTADAVVGGNGTREPGSEVREVHTARQGVDLLRREPLAERLVVGHRVEGDDALRRAPDVGAP